MLLALISSERETFSDAKQLQSSSSREGNIGARLDVTADKQNISFDYQFQAEKIRMLVFVLIARSLESHPVSSLILNS